LLEPINGCLHMFPLKRLWVCQPGKPSYTGGCKQQALCRQRQHFQTAQLESLEIFVKSDLTQSSDFKGFGGLAHRRPG
jgi:hypothetical protein